MLEPQLPRVRKARHRRKVRNYRARLWRHAIAASGDHPLPRLARHLEPHLATLPRWFDERIACECRADPILRVGYVLARPWDGAAALAHRMRIRDRASARAYVAACAAGAAGAARGRHFRRALETGQALPGDYLSLARAFARLPIIEHHTLGWVAPTAN